MGCSTLTGAPILFKDGAKLWSHFDTAMRVMKRDFNPIWDIRWTHARFHYFTLEHQFWFALHGVDFTHSSV
ncbi:unnamed protein product [Pylaiella littoralis]